MLSGGAYTWKRENCDFECRESREETLENGKTCIPSVRKAGRRHLKTGKLEFRVSGESWISKWLLMFAGKIIRTEGTNGRFEKAVRKTDKYTGCAD